MSKPQVGECWQYKFLSQVVTGEIIKIRCFGLLHLIKYRECWTDGYPVHIAYKWKFSWKAIEKV